MFSKVLAFDPAQADALRFKPLRPGKWLANLPQLARDRLAAAGVTQVSGGSWCTVEDRVTVLLVPARRRHRPHGGCHLAALMRLLFSRPPRTPAHRCAHHVQHDRQRQHAVQQQA